MLLLRSVAMPVRSFEVTPELDQFIASKVENGMFKDPSGMVRAALRVLQRELQQHEAKVEALGEALDGADVETVAEGDVFHDVREDLGLPSRSAVA